MPASPPTKHTPEVLEKAAQYISTWSKNGDVIPTVEALSSFIGIGRTQIYKWNKDEDKPEITNMLETIKKEQKRILLNKGLTGDFNSNITKLILHQHGLHDKQDKDITSQGDKIGFNITFQDGVSQGKDENSEN